MSAGGGGRGRGRGLREPRQPNLHEACAIAVNSITQGFVDGLDQFARQDIDFEQLERVRTRYNHHRIKLVKDLHAAGDTPNLGMSKIG